MAVDPLDYDRLVLSWCWRLGASQPIKDSVEYSDGWVGLLKAIKNWEQTERAAGRDLLAYASRGIKMEIMGKRSARTTVKRGGIGQNGNYKPRLTYAFSQLEDFDAIDAKASDAMEVAHNRDLCGRLLGAMRESDVDMVWGVVAEERGVRDVAKNSGVTHTRVVQKVRRGLEAARNEARSIS